MLKMKNKKNYFEIIDKISIETRMAIVHVIFFFSIFFTLFIFVMINSIKLYKFNIQTDLNGVVDTIIEHIESGGDIEENSILGLIGDKDIKITIFKEELKNISFDKDKEFIIDGVKEKFSYELEPSDVEIPFIDLNRIPKDDIRTTKFQGTRYLYVEKILEYNEDIYFIQVFKDSETEDEILKNFYIICIIVNIIGLFSSYFISKLINRKFLKVIRNISKTAEDISINGLSKRIRVPKSNDELTHLTITINDMLDRLEKVVTRQNQFISDVSHELRTPISVIKGYADLISRWGKNDINILEESIDSIKDEADHMTNLIKKLMFLARENELEFNKEVIFLNEMLEDICKDLKIINEDVVIDLYFQEDISFLGDENLIKQMIWIFIDNAIKYSGKDTPKITISLFRENSYNYISIQDNGRGISEKDLEFIFDRFYRGDKSRSKEIAGSGLGLSIAKLIANKHKGEISVQSELHKGSVFTIKLPENLN